jgi:hypothetical protein
MPCWECQWVAARLLSAYVGAIRVGEPTCLSQMLVNIHPNGCVINKYMAGLVGCIPHYSLRGVLICSCAMHRPRSKMSLVEW